MRTFRPGGGHPVLYGVNTQQIVEWVKVTDRTVRRWKRGEEPPWAALRWIEICSTGDLGLIDPAWDGWRLREGKLIDATGQEFMPGEIMGIPFLRQLIAHYQTEQSIPRQADWIEEKYVPAPEVSVV